MKKAVLILTALMMSVGISAQTGLGSIKGRVLNGVNENSPIPGAVVWVEEAGQKRMAKTDLDGNFSIDALNPGVYNLTVKASQMDTLRISAISVSRDKITNLEDLAMQGASMLGMVVVTYEPRLIEKEIHRIEIKTEDIAHSPNVLNPKQLFASMNSDVIIKEGTGDMIIRGSRPGDVIYYIDGVKVRDLNGIPGAAIGGMMGYTGGIPAKYGDTTGGIVALETKSYFDLYYAWKAKQQ
jgi:hypothetical protein